MAGSLNKAWVIGYTGMDPKTRTMDNGDTVVRVTVATSDHWKNDKGEKQERVTWHNVCSFNQNLNKVFNEQVKKGDLVSIEGQTQHREYEKDGQKKQVTEIVLQKFKGELTLLGKKSGPA